ncbi:GNAT family N-acetyltransferase [Actinomadura sp. 6N118]|uniref:GNAT family N-acetyltransferase n=1 Tax=Actinomadura sp. 6N118 TaxID=3375151 RepID=UPI0037AF5825
MEPQTHTPRVPEGHLKNANGPVDIHAMTSYGDIVVRRLCPLNTSKETPMSDAISVEGLAITLKDQPVPPQPGRPPGVGLHVPGMAITADHVRAEPVDVRITRVEPAGEEPNGARVRAWHAVVAASMAQDLPGMAPSTPDRLHAYLTSATTLVWTAGRAGEVVGLAVLRLPAAAVTGRAQVHVHPAHRRCGIGDRLVAALISGARFHGLHTVTVAVPVGGTGDAFCLRRGLVRLRTLHHLLLSLREMHPGWLAEMVAAEHPGYHLTGTTQITPPGRDTAVPAEALLTVTAEHGRQIASCTEVLVPGGTGPRATGPRATGPRATQHDHRPAADGHHGLGLDLWIKAAMLRTLYDQHPQLTQVVTDNPEHATTLLAVNHHLGFRLHHRTNQYRLDVTGSSATN